MRSTNRSSAGFSLLELLLASSIGLILFGVGMTLLMGDAKRSAAMAAALQGRRWQRRTLALIQADLARAASWQIDPEPSTSWPCALAGRHPRLVIKPRDGSPPVVYALPESDHRWCGPGGVALAYLWRLEGSPLGGGLPEPSRAGWGGSLRRDSPSGPARAPVGTGATAR